MDLLNKMQEVYKTSTSYPELVKKLIGLGILSYTVDVATSTILYRLSEGKNLVHPGQTNARTIAAKFDQPQTLQAISNTQQGKTDYPTFLDEIAMAGVRLYEATLHGPDKRVTYVGTGGQYEESIPF